jgi:transposase
MICVDANGIPIGIGTESASRHEVVLIEPLLDNLALQNRQPARVIYDKAADSDKLRKRLAERKIDLICPHKKDRVSPPLQDGRKLRRYRRRWIVERTIAWLHNYRRIVTRWERHDYLYESFVILGCVFTLLKRF